MRRYLYNQGIAACASAAYDVVIIGGGIAGLYAALNLDDRLSCAVLTKEGPDVSNSWLAQGGIAAAVSAGDTPQFHFEDTMTAGAGLCDPAAVRVLVDEAPDNIAELQRLHVPFDINEDGDLQTGREGGHRRNRIVHAGGDATGRETVRALAAIAATRSNITFLEDAFLSDIVTENGRAAGVVVYNNGFEAVAARSVIVCTGGVGQVYNRTTNPYVATGDGLAAALRAGAAIADMAFVQFHPTGLYCEKPESRSFLISEAVRGEGGVLRNAAGERFMLGQHPMAELAPRDIVARGIVREMQRTGADHVFLDIMDHSARQLSARFPTIYGECLRRGIDISKQQIPVCPVQHYIMGGIKADLNGMTNIDGLYACGESARSGVHGANRLASNSMLECLVFGRRAARHISERLDGARPHLPDLPDPDILPDPDADLGEAKREIREIMSKDAWIIRNGCGLKSGLEEMEAILARLEGYACTTREMMETLNMAATSAEILKAALDRKESVGAHYRES